MEYKMLALDLDGTLTNSKKEITAPTRAALIKLMEHGKKVVFTSGRPTKGVLPLIDELQLHEFESYVISYNGARITNCKTGEHVYNRVLPENFIADAYDIAIQYGVDFVTYDDAYMYCNRKPNEYTVYESRTEGMDILVKEHFVEEIDFPLNKCMMVGAPEIIAEVEKELLSRFGNSLSIYRSEPFFAEIMPENVSKATTLARLLEITEMRREELIACGDGYNDLPMIEFAGLGVAMANAQDVVKAKADFITKSNDEDGVLHVIEEFMGV